MTDLVQKLRDYHLEVHPDGLLLEEAATAIETLTCYKAVLEESWRETMRKEREVHKYTEDLRHSVIEEKDHYKARAEVAKSALREALDVVRALIPEGWGDGTMDHMPGIEAARAFIEKHSP